MATEASINSSKYNVLKLATDGSNWVTYHARMTVIQAAKGHMPHIRGTARKPPLSPTYRAHKPPRPSLCRCTRCDQTYRDGQSDFYHYPRDDDDGRTGD